MKFDPRTDGELMDAIFGDGAGEELTGHFTEYNKAHADIIQPEFRNSIYQLALNDVLNMVHELSPGQQLAVLTGAIVHVSKIGGPAIKQRAVEFTEVTVNALNDEIIRDLGPLGTSEFKDGLHASTLKRLSKHAGFSEVDVITS